MHGRRDIVRIGLNSGIQESKRVTTTQKITYFLADTKEFEKSQTPFHSNRTDNKNGDEDGDRGQHPFLTQKSLQIKTPVNPFLG